MDALLNGSSRRNKVDTADLSFTEAIAYAESRGVVLPDIYYSLLIGTQRSKATSIAGLASLEQIKFVIDQVSTALKNGSTFKDFQNSVKTGVVKIDLPAYRLDNIFRTNIQVAYNRGRWEQQKRAAVSRPYLMYDAINDGRTRPNHSVMDGVVLPRDDPWWRTHYPPCGYRCRCTVISLSETQAQKRGVTPMPPPVDPDEGWSFNPGEDYTGALDKALNEFGADLVHYKPRLTKVVEESKKKVREAVEAAKHNRDGAPKAKGYKQN